MPFERWFGRFYDLVEDDELLGPVFGGTVGEQHRRDVVVRGDGGSRGMHRCPLRVRAHARPTPWVSHRW
jgi:hypothetical protein